MWLSHLVFRAKGRLNKTAVKTTSLFSTYVNLSVRQDPTGTFANSRFDSSAPNVLTEGHKYAFHRNAL